jgi:hypothetical protein
MSESPQRESAELCLKSAGICDTLMRETLKFAGVVLRS